MPYYLRIKQGKIVEMIDTTKHLQYEPDLIPVTEREYAIARAYKGDIKKAYEETIRLRSEIEHHP